MVGDKHFAFKVLVQPTSEASYREFALQQLLRADGAKADDVLRAEDRELILVELSTIGEFLRLGIAITGRTTFHGVEDIDVLALKLAGLDHLRQQLTGSANEGTSRLILVRAGALPKKRDPWIGASLAEDGIGPTAGQLGAPRTAGDLLADDIELSFPRFGVERVAWIRPLG